jgi:hypothetical protein
VKPGSLEILSKSMGYAEKGRFTSDFIYYLKAQGKVLFPPEGSQVEGTVIRKNKMGLYLLIDDAIKVMVPRDLHIGNVDFDEIEMGDTVSVEIKKSRFQVNDRYILSIGMFVKRIGARSTARPAAVAVAAPAFEPVASPDEEDEEEDGAAAAPAPAAPAAPAGEATGSAAPGDAVPAESEERQLENLD